jgi:hypothetical protein
VGSVATSAVNLFAIAVTINPIISGRNCTHGLGMEIVSYVPQQCILVSFTVNKYSVL